MMAFVTPATANRLSFQDVLFGINAVGKTTYLTISWIGGATGNWSNVNYVKGFEIRNIGTITGPNIDPLGGSSTVNHGLAAGAGCSTGVPSAPVFTALRQW